MKHVVYNFFVWCAGSDRNFLDGCPRFEHIKHAGYGILICIPTLLAFVSMSYAVSTLTDNIIWILLSGIFWSFIIFSIDRFIVSTFRKRESVNKDLKSWSFFLRMILAGVLGIALSHPFVLLFFDGSITFELNNQKSIKIETIQKKSKDEKTSIFSKIDAANDSANSEKRDINDELEKIYSDFIKKDSFIDCMVALFTAEQSGTQVILPCGSSSGDKGYNELSENIENIIKKEREDLNQLKEDNQPRIDGLFLQISLIDTLLMQSGKMLYSQIDQVDSSEKRQIRNIEKSFSKDYLAREIALFGEIADDYPQTVWLSSIVIMLVFFAIDISAVTLKVLAERGPYDDWLDEKAIDYRISWQRSKHSAKMKENAFEQFFNEQASEYYKESLKYKEKSKATEKIVDTIFSSIRTFRQKVSKEHIDFGKFYLSNLKRIHKMKGTDELKDEEIKMIKDLRDIFFEKSRKARDEYKDS